MKVSKDAVVKLMNSSGMTIDATRFSPDELRTDKQKTIREMKSLLDRKLTSKKDFTIVLIE